MSFTPILALFFFFPLHTYSMHARVNFLKNIPFEVREYSQNSDLGHSKHVLRKKMLRQYFKGQF